LTQRARKFAGVWLMLALLIVYPTLAVLIYTELLGGFFETLPDTAENWVTLVYFIVAGLGWAFPAGFIIKWMARPDKTA